MRAANYVSVQGAKCEGTSNSGKTQKQTRHWISYQI